MRSRNCPMLSLLGSRNEENQRVQRNPPETRRLSIARSADDLTRLPRSGFVQQPISGRVSETKTVRNSAKVAREQAFIDIRTQMRSNLLPRRSRGFPDTTLGFNEAAVT